MRRRLVLTTQAARHPFRQSMAASLQERTRRNDEQDLRLFVLSFTAFFVCIYSILP